MAFERRDGAFAMTRGFVRIPAHGRFFGLFVALRDHLPEDYLVYYDVRVKDRRPDFIIIGPDLGVVVLEVKDWQLKRIVGTSADGVVLRALDGSEQIVKHPLQQARDYTLRTIDLLKQRPLLRDRERLCCGWGHAAVLPSMKGGDIQSPTLFGPSLEEALGPGLVLTGDDLAPDRLLPRLRALIPAWAQGRSPLTPEQIDEIRGVLHPEIRIGWGSADADILAFMDREQERVARSLGDGHRLMRGVAGSGKTVALICRARHLRQVHSDWRILVLCYNHVLAGSDRRTKPVLRLNYRNTRPILAAAYRLIRDLDSKTAAARDPEDEYVVPDRAIRNGRPPEIHRNGSAQATRQYARDWIRTRRRQGVAPEEILVLDVHRPAIEDLAAWLNNSGVPASDISAGAVDGHVRVSTIHSAKGLDASHVMLVDGDALDRRSDEDGRRLLYIAMTRAREELCVCYRGDARLMAELRAVVAELDAKP